MEILKFSIDLRIVSDGDFSISLGGAEAIWPVVLDMLSGALRVLPHVSCNFSAGTGAFGGLLDISRSSDVEFSDFPPSADSDRENSFASGDNRETFSVLLDMLSELGRGSLHAL